MARINEESLKVKIDKKDRDILKVLELNARETFQQISKKVALSHDSVAYRVKRLEKLGVIDKYALDVDFRSFGLQKYHVLFQFFENNQKKINDFFAFLQQDKRIIQIIHYTDKWDLKITIIAKDVAEFDDILTEINNKFSEILIDFEIMQEIKDYFEPEKRKHEEFKFDDVDKKIINILAKNSRAQFTEIAEKTGLSTDAIIYRMKKYAESDFLKKYTIHLDQNKLGYHTYNVLLMMKMLDKKQEAKLREIIVQEKQIVEGIKSLGDWNIILSIVAEQPKEFHETIKMLKTLFAEELKDYDTLLAYKELKNEFSV